MTEPDFPLQAGNTLTVAMLSPCVGGLLRTWTDTGPSQLWSVPDANDLRALQGTGVVSRTVREQSRYREAGLLNAGSGTLILQERFPAQSEDGSLAVGARVFRLEQPREPTTSPIEEFRKAFCQAIQHCVRTGEFLVVETGGWDAPHEPYCFFMVTAGDDGPVNVIETAPQPLGSIVWAPQCIPGQTGATVQAPSTRETLDTAAPFMMEAIGTWGLAPWDLAFTFGTR